MVVGSLCVMPLENAGDFKTVLLLVQAPVSESATFNTLAQSILSSYTAPLPTLQLMLKPWDQIAGRTIVLMDPPSAQCFNLSVLRATSANQLPRACGGSAP